MELIDLYRDSVAAFARLVAHIKDDQWQAPTPCPGWDVRTLVNHVVAEERWSVPLFAGATVAEVGDRFAGDVLGDDPVRGAGEAAEDAAAAVSETGALERTIHLSMGETPAIEYVHQLFADHVIHGWDLAVAIGRDPTLNPEATRAALAWFRDRENLYRDGGLTGPRPAIAPDASEQDQLLAAFGRDPTHLI